MAAPGDVEAIRTRLADALAQLRAELEAEEARLRGPAAQLPTPTAVAPAPAGPARRAVKILTGAEEAAAAPVPVPETLTLQQTLRQLLIGGLKTRPFDITDAVIAPNAITDKGNEWDAGQYWDSWILSPTIDARISFTGPPSQNTPIIASGLTMNFGLHARKVYYVSAVAGLSGSLNVWLAKYRED